MSKKFDVLDVGGEQWLYSDKVKRHFFHPKGVLTENLKEEDFDAVGEVGSPACGDVMKIWIKVADNKIADLKWKTFGCASAIASTSILSEMAVGKTLARAYKITAQDIVRSLGGLPRRKIHCSILGDQALRKAIDNYRKSEKSKGTK